MVRENHPILFEVAQPSIGLTTDDLVDVNHPVNSKSLSGKRKGMGVMIDDVIYVAMGSAPDARWVQFSDIKEPVPAPFKEAIFEIRENLEPTMLKDLATGQSDPLNIGDMPPLDPDHAGAGFMMLKKGKLGFQMMKEGTYKVVVSGFIHGQTEQLNNSRVTVFLHNGAKGEVMLGGSDSVVLYQIREGSYFGHFTLMAYDHLRENDTIMVKIGGDTANKGQPVIVENATLTVEPV